MRDIVLTSEILTLLDMTGYFVAPGDYPIAKVDYDYVLTERLLKDLLSAMALALPLRIC